jgi:hypothetical protein
MAFAPIRLRVEDPTHAILLWKPWRGGAGRAARQTGKVRVIVDLADIQYKPAPTRSPDRPQADSSALNTRIEQLQAELAKLEVKKTALKPAWPHTGAISSVSVTVVTS